MIIFYLSQVGAGVSTNWLDITGTRPPIGTTFRIVADKAMAIGLGVSMITIY